MKPTSYFTKKNCLYMFNKWNKLIDLLKIIFK